MYRNSRRTILFPLLLAAGVVAGLLLGQFLGRNSLESRMRNVLQGLSLPTNKLTYTTVSYTHLTLPTKRIV